MLIDLKFDGKFIVVVGGGSEGYRKILNFLNSGSKILVVSKTFSSGIKKLHLAQKIDLLKVEVKDAAAFVKGLKPKPDLLIAVTNDHGLNSELVKQAKTLNCMVYAVDNPAISDFTLPSLTASGRSKNSHINRGKKPSDGQSFKAKNKENDHRRRLASN